ncbi:MAG: alginate biosynthesis protein [Rhizobium sp.]|nr:alginate biosynthesis protein [Rhizobium sp.]
MTPVRKTSMFAGTALAAIIVAAGNQARAETTGGNAASGYGCNSLEEIAELQMIEGKDGMFFRILADLRLQHAFTKQTVDHLAAMAKALEKNGTTLIYVPLPTKSQVLPELVPARASLYGFDADIATEIYDDVVRRLNEKGVAAVDIATPMRKNNRNGFGEYSFFEADFHWTAHGADVAAKAIGDTLKALPAYADVTPAQFEMKEVPPPEEFSSMRELLQKHCVTHVPTVTAHTYEAVRTQDASAETGPMDIFGSGDEATIALIGTSYSDKPISNFWGYLEHWTGIPVENYSISGGNQFGSILSYITSREFQERRPRFLIWENPIYNNLGQYGGAPWAEIVAASLGECSPAIPAETSGENAIAADLSDTKLGQDDVILADIGSDSSRKATFTLTGTDGIVRTRSIERGDRLRSTGRYFFSLGGFPDGALDKISVSFDAPVGETTTLSICKTKTGEQS